MIEQLFKGGLCQYPEEYDNFGSTPLTPDCDGKCNCDVYEEDEGELKALQEKVLLILEKATSIEHSYWKGESGTERRK